MKINLFSKLAFLCLFVVSFVSCSKDSEPTIEPDAQKVEGVSVRPDFATLDDRPVDVIKEHQVTDLHAEAVSVNNLKAAGGKYALVIGISDYRGSSSDLQYCDDDATDWYYRLRDEGYTVDYLLNGSATKSAIESKVKALASKAGSGAEIAFCYSGHGSNGNIISSDLYYINASWFKTTFANARSKKMMFCFDACQIGKMKTLAKTGRVVAVASDYTLLAYDGDRYMKNGVFTYYMMEKFNSTYNPILEHSCSYAINKMKEWGRNNRCDVNPSYVDNYDGNFEL